MIHGIMMKRYPAWMTREEAEAEYGEELTEDEKYKTY